MRHSIDTKLLQDILNYLASKPFNEVSGVIKAVQDDVKVVEGSEVPAEEKTA